MKRIKINNLEYTEKQTIDRAVDYLLYGKIIVCPTDTVYGLSCLADNQGAVEKIYQTKNRSRKKPLLVLVDSLDMAREYFEIDKAQEEYLRSKWPGPISFLLKDKGKLASNLNFARDGLAVRLPKNEFLIKIISKLGKPLASTSLNKSGEKILVRVSDIEKYFKEEEIDLVIDGGILKGEPSRIMDLRDEADGKKIR